VTPAADQYSVGATLYNLLTDAVPHNLPRNVGQALVAILTEAPVPIRERRGDLDPRLAEVIHRSLNREAADRYTNVSEFAQALLPFAT